MSRIPLTTELLKVSASKFVRSEMATVRPELFGVTDGKAIGTAIEHLFKEWLAETFTYEMGNSGKGLDFPGINVDLKVTSESQPQSSSPFRSAVQKVYGLGYHLLVMVYRKVDDPIGKIAKLEFIHVLYIRDDHTGDASLTSRLRDMVESGATTIEIAAYLEQRDLPVYGNELSALAERILDEPPAEGAITISNALQWRLNYGKAIKASTDTGVEGVTDLVGEQ